MPSLLPKLLNLRWPQTLISGMLIGLCLIGWSQAIGVFDLRIPPSGNGSRQVGYGAALNWSIAYFIFFPIAASLLIATLREVESVLEKLAALKILDGGPELKNGADAVFTDWMDGTPTRRGLIAVLGVTFPFF